MAKNPKHLRKKAHNVPQVHMILDNYPEEFVEKIRSKHKRKRNADKELRRRAKQSVLKAARKRKLAELEAA